MKPVVEIPWWLALPVGFIMFGLILVYGLLVLVAIGVTVIVMALVVIVKAL